MDLIKHGESAYPADAWVERQYSEPQMNNDEVKIDSYLAIQGRAHFFWKGLFNQTDMFKVRFFSTCFKKSFFLKIQ